MNFQPVAIKKPTLKEKRALRLMIIIGVISIVFFMYTLWHKAVVGNYPLYVLLMIALTYYCLKYLHEWYHYFSISADEPPVTSKIYTVDILTTFCAGEPFDMLQQTLEAIQKITYPHTAWCCDEADDPLVKNLCLQLGVKHVTRLIKKNAKAGNINNALQYATGELCVVLDPDHIPAPEMLDHLVAYFDDQSIGFVQIVQAYYNQKESLVAKGAAQQTYQFYGPMMMAMHSYGTVQAIGANCTFRRAALDSIGGHASGLSEDMHTAMQMHAKGWRSVYVPSILTRGLVPATLSSYYKQQLKWSRGTWELLLVTYPKLFNKFTWRQKIHYLTLPFHYLSGLIFVINFLIPVIALFTGIIPLKMDVFSFLLASLPFFAMGLFIRHYVQKWVAEETDRGFHLVGGILQIGTWWVHSVGFVYTLFRKKVPYIPTPKNDSDSLPLQYNLPNIAVLVISLAAIIYGLWNDYNPYTAFMVVLASMQIFFMVFILSVSGYVNKKSVIGNIASKLRGSTWLIEKTHSLLRNYSLSLSFLVVAVFIFAFYKQQQLPTFLPKPLPSLQVFYKGVYQAEGVGKLTGLSTVFNKEKGTDNIAVVAFTITWNEEEINKLPVDAFKEVYQHNAVPMMVWRQWQKDSAGNIGKDNFVFRHIIDGKYDAAITTLARQVAALQKPVFMRVSQETEGNKRSLFAAFNSQPQEFIQAWRHVHQIFDQAKADRVIWIWNPWDALTANDYFPGSKYVDWLGVQIKNSQFEKYKNVAAGFDSLYRPYHQSDVFNMGLPVIITEASTVNNIWWHQAWQNRDTSFKEIKAVVFLNDAATVAKKTSVDAKPVAFSDILTIAPAGSEPIFESPVLFSDISKSSIQYSLPANVRSVVYDKGFNWFRNRHTLMLKTMEADVAEMKSIGINTVERTMPGFYDKNLGKVLMQNKMNLVGRFNYYVTPEIVENDKKMQQEKEKILALVKENLDKKYIIAWSLGNDVLFNLETQTFKPDYFYYQNKYITWLANLCTQIRLIDSVRPLVMDLNWDVKGRERFHLYKKYVTEIDRFLLVADVKNIAGFSEPLEDGMAWGKVQVEFWPKIAAMYKTGTIPVWQDIENTDNINLEGIVDMEGRKKQWVKNVANTWGNLKTAPSPIPDIKILKPAKTTNANLSLRYHVMLNKDSTQWRLYKEESKELHFEWYLVRLDQFKNRMFIKKVGEGPFIDLSIPGEPQFYQLYVEAILGDNVKVVNSTLNTPLQ